MTAVSTREALHTFLQTQQGGGILRTEANGNLSGTLLMLSGTRTVTGVAWVSCGN